MKASKYLVLIATLHSTMFATKGALLVYEPFDYPENAPLLGQTNGIGFSSPWRAGGFNVNIHDIFQVRPGVISYPGLAMRGTNHIAADAVVTSEIAGLSRMLTAELTKPGSTTYLSFLHRPDAELEYSSVVVGTGDSVELSIGKSGSLNRYHLSQRGGRNRVVSEVEPIVGKVAFIVVKMEILDGPDRFTLFVNPIPGKPEPDDGLVNENIDLEAADRITVYSRGAWSVDEIRIGTTWTDVTPAVGASK